MKHDKITDAHSLGIANVIVAWAKLEWSVIFALQSLLDVDAAAAILTFFHASYAQKRDRLSALFGISFLGQQMVDEFDGLMRRLDQCYAVRNTVAHSIWIEGSILNSIAPVEFRARSRKLKYTNTRRDGAVAPQHLELDDFTPERFLSEAQKIVHLNDDVQRFFANHFRAEFHGRRPRNAEFEKMKKPL